MMIAWPSTSLRVCVVLATVLASAATACGTPDTAVPSLPDTPLAASTAGDPSPTPNPAFPGGGGVLGDVPGSQRQQHPVRILGQPLSSGGGSGRRQALWPLGGYSISGRSVRSRRNTAMKQLKEYQRALHDAQPFSIPEVNTTGLDLNHSRLVVGVDCESSLDRVRLFLQQRLPPPAMEIVVVEVLPRGYPANRPTKFSMHTSRDHRPGHGAFDAWLRRTLRGVRHRQCLPAGAVTGGGGTTRDRGVGPQGISRSPGSASGPRDLHVGSTDGMVRIGQGRHIQGFRSGDGHR